MTTNSTETPSNDEDCTDQTVEDGKGEDGRSGKEGEGKPVKLGDDWKTALQKFLKRQDNSEE